MLCLFVLPAQEDIAEGFFDEEVTAGFILPVGIEFDQNGNGYVREKGGRVFAIDPITADKTLILDISEEVASWGDHGFTGFAFDPDFLENGYLYAAYTVDRYHLLHYGKTDYDPDSSIVTNATIGRVSRFTFDVNASPIELVPESQKVLLGRDLSDGMPILADFHGVGSLAFGNDGSLFVTCGDAGLDSESNVVYHTAQALADGIIDSSMVIGPYRSQSLYSVNGKLLRINKENGEGFSSNPYYDPANPRSPQSRIWALGFRNPYKFMHLPGSGSHNPNLGDPGMFIVGDVGSAYWEEFNIVKAPAQNFGWPVYEGHRGAWPFGFQAIENTHAENPFYNGSTCDRKYFWYNELIAQDNESGNYDLGIPCEGITDLIPSSVPTYLHTRPFIYYSNIKWNTPKRSFVPRYDDDGSAMESPSDKQIEGYSALPGSWYEEGSLPDSFYQSLIVSDFSGWIKAFKFNEDYELEKILNLRSKINGIVDVTLNPLDGCLYYTNIITGKLQKICFGGNPPPIAVAKSDTTYGGNDLTVNFDASASYDPNQLPISVLWDFGDGETSDLEIVEHQFTSTNSSPRKFSVLLTVTDSLGEIGQDSIDISLNNTPPLAKITSPNAETRYAINGYNRIDLEAEVSDKEEGAAALQYTWQVHLHHNLHFHSDEPVHKETFSSLLEPIGCAEKDEYWFRISLQVEDSYGLTDDDEILIYPNCDEYAEVEWKRYNSDEASIVLNWAVDKDYERIIVQKLNDAGDITDLGRATDDTFRDREPFLGSNRYRLKIFRNNGYFYSSEKIIGFPVKSLAVFPNPNRTGRLSIQLDQHLGEDVVIEIISISGVSLSKKVYTDPRGEDFEESISISDLAKGVYILKIENGDRIFHQKFEVVD